MHIPHLVHGAEFFQLGHARCWYAEHQAILAFLIEQRAFLQLLRGGLARHPVGHQQRLLAHALNQDPLPARNVHQQAVQLRPRILRRTNQRSLGAVRGFIQQVRLVGNHLHRGNFGKAALEHPVHFVHHQRRESLPKHFGFMQCCSHLRAVRERGVAHFPLDQAIKVRAVSGQQLPKRRRAAVHPDALGNLQKVLGDRLSLGLQQADGLQLE
mmetsp:Transcript_107415/g.256658  ORF Transcript_107415/g.256658 Transcript_107415/m.256658 type:complete len:212 (-) Transcript_107415:2036-2671(-)